MEILNKMQKIAEEIGFDLVGVANVAIGEGNSSTSSEHSSIAENTAIDEWVKNGYYADMKWFAETVEKRNDILKVMPDAKSVICVAMNYYHDANIRMYANDTNNANKKNAVGKIARYALGKDYHKIFDKKLKLFVKRLEEEILLRQLADQDDKGEEPKFKYYCDTGPVLERMWAAQSGLGFVGKNTNLITKCGSWVLLGEIITNVELKSPWQSFSHQLGGDLTPPALDKCFAPLRTNSTSPLNDSKKTAKEISQQNKVGCGDCRRCLDACPTGALVVPYTVDARKCISYLTIEHKGEIPMELREKVGNRIFGCDACQEVCPFNIGRQTEGINFKTEAKLEKINATELDLKEILSIKTDEEFLKKFAGSPLMRAKRRGLVRNACIAAGNSGDKSLLPYLEECLKDNNAIISEAARRAIEKLKKEI